MHIQVNTVQFIAGFIIFVSQTGFIQIEHALQHLYI